MAGIRGTNDMVNRMRGGQDVNGSVYVRRGGALLRPLIVNRPASGGAAPARQCAPAMPVEWYTEAKNALPSPWGEGGAAAGRDG